MINIVILYLTVKKRLSFLAAAALPGLSLRAKAYTWPLTQEGSVDLILADIFRCKYGDNSSTSALLQIVK